MGGRPLGITIVAIVLFFGGLTQFVVGTETLGYTDFGLAAAADAAGVSGWASMIGGSVTMCVAAGLFTLKGWAWLLAVLVLAIRVAVDLFAIVTHGLSSSLGIAAVTGLVISGVILWYFMRPNIKAAFGR